MLTKYFRVLSVHAGRIFFMAIFKKTDVGEKQLMAERSVCHHQQCFFVILNAVKALPGHASDPDSYRDCRR